VLDAPDISTHTFRTIFSEQETDTDQFNLSASWVKNEGVSVKFGVGVMSTEMQALHSETQDFLGGWGVGFDPAGQSDIPDPSLLEQINVLQSLNDLRHGGYPDANMYPTSGYYMTTLGQESFRVDPWSFAQAMEPFYPNWDRAIPSPAAYDNTVEEDIHWPMQRSSMAKSAGWDADGSLACATSRPKAGPSRISSNDSSGRRITISSGFSALAWWLSVTRRITTISCRTSTSRWR
jgi:hypothetical protein